MNLFISENFIDTIGRRVNVLQLIRQVAEDDELVHSEAMAALKVVLDYENTDALENDIVDGDFEDIRLQDDILYVGGETLVDLFEELYPGDYADVIGALVASIWASEAPTLRLDHNCVVPVEPAPDYLEQTVTDNEVYRDDSAEVVAPNPAAAVEQPAPFQEDPAEAEVLRTEVAVLSSETVLGTLTFNGKAIPTLYPAGKNGIVFDVLALYHAIYGMQYDPEYVHQLIVELNHALDSDDVHIVKGCVYMTEDALAVVHNRLCPLTEWYPMVTHVVMHFIDYATEDSSFNLLGDLEG